MSQVTKLQGNDYVKAFYNLCLKNKYIFRKVSNGNAYTGTRYNDWENIDTSAFAWLASRRSDKPIAPTTAERIFRRLRAYDRDRRYSYFKKLKKSKLSVVNG